MIRRVFIGLALLLPALRSVAGCPSYTSTNTQTGTCNEAAGNKTFDQTGWGNYATLTVNGDLTINGNFTIRDKVVVNGTLYVTGTLIGSLGGELDVSSGGVVIVDGNVDLTYLGTTVIEGSMTVGGNFDNGGDGWLDYGNTTVNGVLTVGGTFTNAGNGTLDGTGTLISNVVDNGDSTGFLGTYIGSCTGNCDGTLPVTFIRFDGEVDENGNCLLEWSTGEETNNLGFYVERMVNEIEGFVNLGFVKGYGTTVEVQEYSFVDTDFIRDSYYRLRQVDFDGVEDFSATILVYKNDKDPAHKLVVSPNPTVGEVSISGISGNPSVVISLISSNGLEILTNESAQVEEMSAIVTGALLSVPQGIYILSAQIGDEKLTRRIVKN